VKWPYNINVYSVLLSLKFQTVLRNAVLIVLGYNDYSAGLALCRDHLNSNLYVMPIYDVQNGI
jgi:hypothetical protein